MNRLQAFFSKPEAVMHTDRGYSGASKFLLSVALGAALSTPALAQQDMGEAFAKIGVTAVRALTQGEVNRELSKLGLPPELRRAGRDASAVVIDEALGTGAAARSTVRGTVRAAPAQVSTQARDPLAGVPTIQTGLRADLVAKTADNRSLVLRLVDESGQDISKSVADSNGLPYNSVRRGVVIPTEVAVRWLENTGIAAPWVQQRGLDKFVAENYQQPVRAAERAPVTQSTGISL